MTATPAATPAEARPPGAGPAQGLAPVTTSALLAVVADPVRWRLLAHLSGGQTTCVCELQPIAAVAGNLLSYHLRILREAGLVTTERRGRWVDYTIAADAAERLRAALPTADSTADSTTGPAS